jgi:hypothetical protein
MPVRPPPWHTLTYRCEVPGCGKRFECPSRLQAHQRSHTKSYSCPHGCPEAYSRWSDLVAHRAAVHATHRCDTCGKAFQEEAHLQRHIETHSKVAQTHVCRVAGCGKTYTSAYNLGAHHRSVHTALTFACPATGCGRVFAHKVPFSSACCKLMASARCANTLALMNLRYVQLLEFYIYSGTLWRLADHLADCLSHLSSPC